jgi:hypothetical protein
MTIGLVASVAAPAPLAGQSAATRPETTKPAATKAWTPPRTADGQPDLQGVWLNSSATPLERPKALEGRATLTDAEVAELKQRAARLLADDTNDFPGGDSLFLAALGNVAQYKNPNRTTGTAADSIEREFDNRTSLIVEPPDGKIPWTPEGKRRYDAGVTAGQAAAAAGPEDLTNVIRCLTYGVPRLGVNNASGAGAMGYYQIVQAPGYVVFEYEAIHEGRIIPLYDKPHLPASIRQWSGDSRGRWEGTTLVVETINFSPNANVMGAGEHLRLIERFTRVAPDRIDYRMTLDDPTTWTKPWTVVIRLKATQAPIYEYACHEGNLEVMHGVLAGTRGTEKAR